MSESDIITFEKIVELEAQVLKKRLFEQYLNKLIELLNVKIQLYLTAAEADCPWTNDLPEEMFLLCTAPLKARHEAANYVLSHPDLPRSSICDAS
jgi:hypothetical protein